MVEWRNTGKGREMTGENECDSIYVDLQLINDFNFISDFHRVMKLNGMLYIWYNTWINIHIYMYNQFKSKSVNIKSVINSKL